MSVDLRAIREAAEAGDIHRGMELLTRDTVLALVRVCEAAQEWDKGAHLAPDQIHWKYEAAGRLRESVRALGHE